MNEILIDHIINHGYDLNLLKQNNLTLTSLIDEVLYCAIKYTKEPQDIIVVKNNAYEASRFYSCLISFISEDKCHLFIPEESLRVESIASSPENRANTVETMNALLKDGPKILVTSAGSLVRYVPSKETFKNTIINLKRDNEININDLKETLIRSGYKFTSKVDQPLTFSIRGGIIDVYSINYDDPIRIELFDTEIDSIRFFDVSTQRTIRQIEEVEIIPATYNIFNHDDVEELKEVINGLIEKNNLYQEVLERDLDYIVNGINNNNLYVYFSYLKKRYHITDYLNDPVIILYDFNKLKTSVKTLFEDTISYVQELSSVHKMINRFSVFDELNSVIDNYKTIETDSLVGNLKSKVMEVNMPKGNISFKMNIILEYPNEYKVILINENEAKEVLDYLVKNNIVYNMAIDHLEEGINLIFTDIQEGFEFNDLYVIGAHELFDEKVKIGKHANKFEKAIELESYNELEKYDYVVHNQYGIGQYIGIVTKEYNGIKKDYLQVLYAEDDELLVPIEQFNLIRKYQSNTGAKVKLHKLGSNAWSKTKKKVQENVTDLAQRLVKLYSERKQEQGFKYGPDSEDQIAFEKEFKYPLTKDQEIAVQELKKDMESDYPMDRLICGDVGFGKTEVAIRGAFKAVYNGKQVAFLCPTTVLSMQHYETFINRFKNYPVKIAVLNRFITKANQKEIIKEINEGKIDIVIGTHRILSQDLKFKDLGLLIIDEEQRFGVEHKEKISELKGNIDVLSLSATPIPRTLQMSLIGMRQLSTLNTPPKDRLPVQTYVVEKTKGLINEVISRELMRNGQVFYLYNDIKRIYEIANEISKNVKGAKVKVVHGQMDKEAIEEVMVDFNLNLVNVLVCTTIIETGIDIPNANTIIIENAHKFGLSQLYQIKGRVGRSDRLAYAYLLIPKGMQVKEVQEKRLKAIKEFTELGSGYKIAQRDLMIRGAGEILGPQQSGFIDSVGIDLYLDMLKEAIEVEQGTKKETVEIKRNNIKADSYIPKAYAPFDYDKIGVYKKINVISDLDELHAYYDYIVDNHGRMPKNVKNLFIQKEIDIYANEMVFNIKETNVSTIIELKESFSSNINGLKLFEFINATNSNINIKYVNRRIILSIPQSKNNIDMVLKVLKGCKGCLK